MDQFPKQICIDCQIKLEASYSFIKQCQESAIKLEEIIKANNGIEAIAIKHEQIDSFEDNSVDIEDNCVDNHEELRNKSVNLKKSLECKRCPMQFDNQQLLADHLKSHSDDPTPAKCHLCGKGFQHKRSIRRHLINVSHYELPLLLSVYPLVNNLYLLTIFRYIRLFLKKIMKT